MTLVEISEREVIEAARLLKPWLVMHLHRLPTSYPVDKFIRAVTVFEERERAAASLDRDPSLVDTQEMPAVVESVCIHNKPLNDDCDSCTALGGRAVDCTVKCPYCGGECKRGFEGHQNHRCASNSSHTWKMGAEPITRPPRKLSRRDQETEKRRRSDPLGADRPEIDYSDDSLPTAR